MSLQKNALRWFTGTEQGLGWDEVRQEFLNVLGKSLVDCLIFVHHDDDIISYMFQWFVIGSPDECLRLYQFTKDWIR